MGVSAGGRLTPIMIASGGSAMPVSRPPSRPSAAGIRGQTGRIHRAVTDPSGCNSRRDPGMWIACPRLDLLARTQAPTATSHVPFGKELP